MARVKWTADPQRPADAKVPDSKADKYGFDSRHPLDDKDQVRRFFRA
jgi:hypothetical protein